MGLSVFLFGGLLATFIILSLFYPLFGILSYLYVYLVLNPELWWGKEIFKIISRPSLVVVVFLCVGCIIQFRKLQWNISRREVELYIFLGIMWLVSLFFGEGMHGRAWYALEKMTKTMVFIFLLIRAVHNRVGVEVVFWGLISAGIVMAYQGHFTGQYVGIRLENIGGLDFREANSMALYMTCGIIFLGFQLLRAPWWGKILCIFGIALMMNNMIMTRSRAGFLGFLLTTPYAFFVMPKQYRKQVSLCIFLGGIMFFVLADDYFIDRMGTIKDEVQSIQLESGLGESERPLNRYDFWKASLSIFKENPIGIGVANFERIVPNYDPRNSGRDAHNTYIICYTEIGLFGIIIFLKIIFGALKQLKRISVEVRKGNLAKYWDLHAVALSCGLMVYLLGGMTTHTYLYHEITWILLAVSICLENAVNEVIKKGDIGL